MAGDSSLVQSGGDGDLGGVQADSRPFDDECPADITGKSVADPVTIPGRYALTENGPA